MKVTRTDSVVLELTGEEAKILSTALLAFTQDCPTDDLFRDLYDAGINDSGYMLTGVDVGIARVVKR